jgi:glycosyltransferase involved in cell wall biosynthesis
MRIALLTEIPAPFRIPLFNALAELEGVDLQVLFLSRNDPRRNYPVYESEFRFGWEVLPGRDLSVGGKWLVLNADVRRRLRRARPDVVIVGGWNQPAFWTALTLRRPTVVWVESTERDERRGRGPAELAKRALVRRAAGFLVPGKAAAEYVRSLGAPEDRIAIAPNAADTSIFMAQQGLSGSEPQSPNRGDLGLDSSAKSEKKCDESRDSGSEPQSPASRCVFICVSRLSREKGVDVLVRAMDGVDATLLVVGDGPDDGLVRSLAPPNVSFAGRVSRDELPALYAHSDVFVMPSRSETWGMAMQEAAAVGLPLIATDAPGAAHDLIEDGVNGYRVPVEDAGALHDALVRAAADPAWRERARIRTLELARGYTPEAWAEAVANLAVKIVP